MTSFLNQLEKKRNCLNSGTDTWDPCQHVAICFTGKETWCKKVT